MSQVRQVAASLHFDVSGPFVDSSVNALTVTANGSVGLDTTHQKYGAGCLHHTGGVNDSVSFPITAGGTADICNALQWTVECWVNFNTLAVPNGQQIIWSTLTGGIPANYIQLFLAASGQLTLQLGGGGAGNPGSVTSAASTIAATGTYYHIACVRDYGRIFMYVNGVQVAAYNGYGSSFTGVIGNSGPTMMVGNSYLGSIQGTQFSGGYIDDFRVITGRAFYTAASITPPAAALADALPTQDVYSGPLNSTPIYDATNVAGFFAVSSYVDFTGLIDPTVFVPANHPVLVFALETYPGTAGVPAVSYGGNACTVGPIAQGSGTQPTRARMYAVLPVTAGMTFSNQHLVVDYTGVATSVFGCSATATLWYGVDSTQLLATIAGSLHEVQQYAGSPPSDFTFGSSISANSSDVLLTFGGGYDNAAPTNYPYVKSTQGYSVVNLFTLNSSSFLSAQQARYLTANATDTITWEQNASSTAYFALLALRLPYLVPVLIITAQPADVGILAGATATFSVTAAQGAPPYTYQWYVNGAMIIGATGSSYTTPIQSAGNNGDQYYVIVTDSAATTIQSRTATLTVGGAAGATVDPFFDSVVFGGTFGLRLFLSEYTYYPMRPSQEGVDLTPAVQYMIINRYKQGPSDTRKRGVDFTLFCEQGEVITNVQMTGIDTVTTPPLVVSNILIDPVSEQTFSYDVSGGVDGTEYKVQFTVTFNTAQNVNEQVIFYIAVASEEQYT